MREREQCHQRALVWCWAQCFWVPSGGCAEGGSERGSL